MLYVTGVMIIAAFLAIGATSAQKHPALSKQTQDNLSTAMHGEAFAYAKYMLYAQHARRNGKKQLAALFESAARMERLQHFREEADLVGLVGSDEDNLRDAIRVNHTKWKPCTVNLLNRLSRLEIRQQQTASKKSAMTR